MELILPILAGFVLGCVHAFDVDHVVAVTAFASKHPDARASARFGFLWGLGHTTTLLVVGLLSVAFRFVIPSAVESFAELLVGILLVVIGIWVLRSVLLKQGVHIHKHEHDGVEHVHIHAHREHTDHRHAHSMFLVGATHGFAGSAAVMVVVPVALSQSLTGAGFYLALFGIGTMVAMSLFAFMIGQVTRSLRGEQTLRVFRGVSGLASLFIGLVWIGGALAG
jgi:sulfite exporter TauE/SafE